MKEFGAQPGGRYAYIDDILNLQELSLAFASIFDECDNFIISGCKVSGNKISAGYVYLNGKIRRFEGTNNISTWPQYIYEVNTIETVQYADNAQKLGRNVYACSIGASVPTAETVLTHAAPQSIEISQTGGLTIKDALYGRYALLLNSRANTQSVNGAVNFTGNIKMVSALFAAGGVKVSEGSTIGRMYDNNGQLVIESQIGNNGVIRKITCDNTNGIAFYVGSERIAKIVESGIICDGVLQGTSSHFGSIYMNGEHVYNRDSNDDEGAIYINYKGYNGSGSNYRNTIIGNGKQGALVEVNGKHNYIKLNTPTILNTPENNALILRANKPQNDMTLCKFMSWEDSEERKMASIGYVKSNSQDFIIQNVVGGVVIQANNGGVNIVGDVKENGTLLSDKYANKESVNEALGQKADADSVYTKQQADRIVSESTEQLSEQINALVEPFGIVKMWAGAQVPNHYHLCNGDALRITDYPKLYAVIGKTFNNAVDANGNQYATEDGYFRLPDLRGRFIAGTHGTDQDYSVIGNAGGKKAVKLTASESGLPVHSHAASGECANGGEHRHVWFGDDQLSNFVQALGGKIHQSYSGYDADSGLSGASNAYETNAEGQHSHKLTISVNNSEAQNASVAHENRPPYYVLAYIMKID